MKLFECQHCGQVLYFENTSCESCGHRLGYLPAPGRLSALEPWEGEEGEKGETWRPLAEPGTPHRLCANAAMDACNWLVPADSDETLCLACRHNRTIPDLSDADNLLRWRKVEAAKHHLFYSLLALGLPLESRAEDPGHGLAFDFLVEVPDGTGNAPTILTGHAEGLITLNLAEADDAERERRRTQMGEPYRTLLGHFRHEVGHHYWDRLVRDRPPLARFRALFGDERADYAAALKAHYEQGPPPDWRDAFVSAYATTHPWEDFAETWAHYLHMTDTLETARAYGLKTRPRVARQEELATEVDFNPYRTGTFQDLVDAWFPLTLAVNSLNRSMGQPDLYPFVLSPKAVEKLGYVHDLVRGKG